MDAVLPAGGELLKISTGKMPLWQGQATDVVGAERVASPSIIETEGVKVIAAIIQLLATACMATLTMVARSQVAPLLARSSETATVAASEHPQLAYVAPTQRTISSNYIFDAFGPYPIAGAAIAAGISQFSNEPTEWSQDVKGYTKRFGSDFGIAVGGTTARYGLAETLRENTLYYSCEFRGVMPRLGHAMISTFAARRGNEGHRVFSLPALVAPYAGAMKAVYAWYPDRFGAKDAFRMGNYSLLAYMGQNIGLEFFYSGPHSLLSRIHLTNAHAAPGPGPNQ